MTQLRIVGKRDARRRRGSDDVQNIDRRQRAELVRERTVKTREPLRARDLRVPIHDAERSCEGRMEAVHDQRNSRIALRERGRDADDALACVVACGREFEWREVRHEFGDEIIDRNRQECDLRVEPS